MNPYIHPQPPSNTGNLSTLIGRGEVSPKIFSTPRERVHHWRGPNKSLGLTINAPILPIGMEGYRILSFNGSFEEYYYNTPHIVKDMLVDVFQDGECLLTECLLITFAALETYENFQSFDLTINSYLEGFIENMSYNDEYEAGYTDEDGDEIAAYQPVIDWGGEQGRAVGQAMFHICCDLFHIVGPTCRGEHITESAYHTECFKVTRLDTEGNDPVLGNIVRFYVAVEQPSSSGEM